MNKTVVDIKRRLVFAPSLWQWDYGQILVPTGVELPDTYEVHFKVAGQDTTMTILGTSDGVQIPDELLTVAQPIVCYIYLHDSESDGETEYKINISVNARPQPSDYEPTPVQQDVITQTIGALQSAMNQWESMTAEAITLEPNEPATASYANGVLTLGIPKGEKGDDGSGGSGEVESVNGKTGAVVLTASDVNALPNSTVIPTKTSELTNDSGFITSIPAEYVTDTELQTAISGKANTADLATVATSGDYDDLLDKPTIPTKTSDLDNDSGFITSVPVQSVNSKTGAVVLDASDVGAIAQETDPTVPSWAKQPNKPTYTASEVGALPDSTTIPTKTSDLQNDSGFLTTAVTSFNGQTGAVVIGNATTSSAGLMSATDKSNLDILVDDYSSALTALGVI